MVLLTPYGIGVYGRKFILRCDFKVCILKSRLIVLFGNKTLPYYVGMEKIKRGYIYDEDVLDKLDEWSEQTGVKKGIAVQAGLWAIMNMDAATRQATIDAMRSRKRIKLKK